MFLFTSLHQKLVKLLLLFFAVATHQTIFSQKFYVQVSSKEIPENFTFDITYTVENGNIENFRAPKFDNFDAYGPSKSENITIINGKFFKSFSLTYTLQPKKQGTFIIAPAQASINGKVMTTNEVEIKIIEPQKKPQQTQQQYYDPFEEFFGGRNKSKPKQKSEEEIKKEISENIFVRVIPSKTSVYEGEQFTLSYKLYFRVQYQGLNALKTPSYNGFLMEEFELPKGEPEVELYNGKKYYVQEFRRVALFPQKTGTLEIAPMDLQCIVGIEKPHPYNPFFTTVEPYEYNFKSNNTIINVLPLPEPKPKNFSGAVGQFSFQASYDKTKVKVGEAIILKVTYNGVGNLRLISSPKLAFPEDFEVYEPKLLENYSTKGDKVAGTKSFEYTLIPQDGGIFTLPEYEFGYFDLESKRYITFKLPKTNIEVKGKALPSVNLINFNKREKESIQKNTLSPNFSKSIYWSNFYTSNIFRVLAFTPLLLFFVGFSIRRKNYTTADLLTINRKRANKVALRRMQQAKKMMNKNLEKEFYNEVIRALWQYVSDKLQIPVAELSKENIALKLAEKNIEESEVIALNETLESCEIALFASTNKIASMQKTYTDAVNWITHIDQKI